MINESPYMHVYFFYFFRGRVGELICKVQVFVSVGPILVTLSWHCNVVVFFLLKTDIFDDY